MSDSERTPPPAEHYPPYVESGEEQKRWDLSLALAREIFGEDGEESVWMAARAIYKSEIET